MKNIMLSLVFMAQGVHGQILFQGLTELPDVKRNTFLCPANTGGSLSSCQDTVQQAIGFDIAGGKLLLLNNNQQYWLQQKAIQSDYLVTVQRYKNEALQQELIKEGWGAMGGYCLLITTNSLVTDFVMPNIVAGKGQVKVVVQLWYNGSDVIQLWSQDAKVVPEGQGVTVVVSSALDNRLLGLVAQEPSNSLKTQFLSRVGIAPANRKNSDYNYATSSPRQVRFG